jgi:hypothetical protein
VTKCAVPTWGGGGRDRIKVERLLNSAGCRQRGHRDIYNSIYRVGVISFKLEFKGCYAIDDDVSSHCKFFCVFVIFLNIQGDPKVAAHYFLIIIKFGVCFATNTEEFKSVQSLSPTFVANNLHYLDQLVVCT